MVDVAYMLVNAVFDMESHSPASIYHQKVVLGKDEKVADINFMLQFFNRRFRATEVFNDGKRSNKNQWFSKQSS